MRFGRSILSIAALLVLTCGASELRCSEILDGVNAAHARQVAEIQASHESAMMAIQKQLEDRTTELEALRRACTPHNANSMTETAAAPEVRNLDQTHLPNLESAPAALVNVKRRAFEAPSLYCSKEDLRSVLDASPQSRREAVVQLLTTNPLCGACIASIASLAPPDSLFAALGCMHQEENRCDAPTGLSRIESLIPFASVSDRDSLIRMVELVEAGACPV
jgi:hypothetical protein